MTDGTYEKGLTGERRAIRYLQNRGMVLLEQRYRSPFGEIDLVMRDGETLVFVEVKARNTGREGSGLLSVGARKQAKIVLTARHYLSTHDCPCAVRFDVLELTTDGVLHVANAFEGSEY
ncbi:MAG TPA: YraN family protein [Candidatus Limiplasma sp.]|nr:YraN family protein [Candidatus Limiplasma sp.]HPS81345.1 YraN family protein [Candidatus Limiplasma sp.]